MIETDARKLVAAWRQRARFYRQRMDRVGRSKCHDGERELQRGLMIMSDLCADELEHLLLRVRSYAEPE
jgi:hypothetical protein